MFRALQRGGQGQLQAWWMGLAGAAACLTGALAEGSVPSSAAAVVAGGPIAGLTPEEAAVFGRGRAAFEEDRGVAQGLGPLFNESSCSRCHNRGGLGGSGFQVAVLAGRVEGGIFDPLSARGGPLIAQVSVSSLASTSVRRTIPECRLAPDGEALPDGANVVARRRTTALFGLGLVEATPDATFIALAGSQPVSIRGRAALVGQSGTALPAVGKFGWKSQFATLTQFSGAAFRNELGITNPEFPTEQLPGGDVSLLRACDVLPEPEDDGRAVRDAAAFIRLLAPIPRLEPAATARVGDGLFTRVGCDGCHVRRLRTGPSPIHALSERDYEPFSDFLLHDMGALADGIGGDGDATPGEMRTAPLWGMHLLNGKRLLHDGRAKSLAAAIAAHDGQAAAARAAFALLPEAKQQALLAFLAGL